MAPLNSGPVVVIGAQKAGTTTLMNDLAECAAFEMDVSTKEESILLSLSKNRKYDEEVLRFFSPANPKNVVVDVSTLYTKSPSIALDVAEVVRLLPNVKLIYIVRERLSRTMSHYRQEKHIGKTIQAADEVVQPGSKYINNSLYGKQLSIWLEHVKKDNIHLVKFEDYVLNRRATVQGICDFVGVESYGVQQVDSKQAFNVTSDRQKFHPLIHKLLASSFYHRMVRKNLTVEVKEKIKSRLSLKKSGKQISSLSDETVSLCKAIFDEDQKLLVKIYPGAPNWD